MLIDFRLPRGIRGRPGDLGHRLVFAQAARSPNPEWSSSRWSGSRISGLDGGRTAYRPSG